MQHLLVVLILFSGTSGVVPIASGQDESQIDEEPVIDRLARTVFFMHAVSASDGKPKVGTGFNVQHNGRQYIVTAKHVVAGAKEVRLLASRKDGSVGWFSISTLTTPAHGSTWITHPTTDLAIHPLVPSLLPGFIGMSIFGGTLYEGEPHLLDQLVAIGFPYAIGSNTRNEHLSPVAKITVLVSWPAFRPNNSGRNILVDPPLYPGFSGAPVYSLDQPPGSLQSRKRLAKLVGIYVGDLTVRDEKRPGREQYLGRVVPADDLIELLNSNDVKAYEDASALSEGT